MVAPVFEFRNASTTIAVQGSPTRTYYKDTRMSLRDVSGNDAEGFILFPLPAPLGTVYSSFILEFEWDKTFSGSHTIQVRRVIAPMVGGLTNLTWNNRPGNTTTDMAAITKSNPAQGEKWSFDITALMNTISAGAPWYGLVVYLQSAPDGYTRYFLNERSGRGAPPTVRAQWSAAPEKPTNVTPSGGRVVSVARPWITTDFIDRNGNTDMKAMDIQIASSLAGWTETDGFPAPDESQTILTGSPAAQLWFDLELDEFVYLTVALQDADDLWSKYSDPVQFGREALGTVELVYPAESPNDYVEDSTPRIQWTFSGVQTAFQVLVYNRDTGTLSYDSGKTYSAELSHTPFQSIISLNYTRYEVEVRVWDDKNRVTTINDPSFASVSREFEYHFTSSVTPVSSTVISAVPGTPWVQIDFERPTPPDYIDITRDGEFIRQNIDPNTLLLPGETTKYRFVDKTPPPRLSHDYLVVTKVNEQSVESDVLTITTTPTTAYLCTVDSDNLVVPLLNYDNGMKRGDDASQVDILGAALSFVVYRGSKGWSGTFAGDVSGELVPDSSAEELLRQLEAVMYTTQGQRLALSWADKMVVGYAWGMESKPVVYNEEIVHRVSFQMIGSDQ